MLYLFSGVQRSGDIRSFLLPMVTAEGYNLVLREVDVKRDAASDLLDPAIWESLVAEITNGEWDVIMLSPPCSTWSRARFRYSGKFGAKPLRNSTYVWGFPWLESSQRELADRGNFFIQQCARAVRSQVAAGKYFLWEHPEDLGRTVNGESPASIWQLPEIRSFVLEAGSTWAINQCDLGAGSAKPTRLLSNLPAAIPLHMGWPAFGPSGEYAGPLLRCRHGWHEPLIGWQQGQYRTSGAEAYPPPLCQYFATLIVSPLRVLTSTETVSALRLPTAEDVASMLPKGCVSVQDAASLVPLLELEEPHLAAGTHKGGAFFAGAYAKRGLVGLRRSCHTHPTCILVFTKLLCRLFPGFRFTSLAVFVNVQTSMHKDIYNDACPNLVVALSDFKQGAIWQEDPTGPVQRSVQGTLRSGVLLDVAKAPVLLHAHSCFHATEPWEGQRVVLVGFSVRHVQDLSSHHKALLDRLGFRWQPASVAQEAKGVTASFSSFGKGAASVETVACSPQEPESLGKAAASDETVARSPQVLRSVGKVAASGETVARSPQVLRSVGKVAASGETVARSPQEPYAVEKETASGETVACSRRGHPSVRSTELMTTGVEFQSVEGLVVVSETESEPECVPSAVDNSSSPPASPLEPGSCSSAGGLGPVSGAPKSLALPSCPADTRVPSVEPFDPTTSRAIGQPLVCRHSKGYHEFVDGLGLCSPGRWRPEQRGRLCNWRESNHAEGLQLVVRNFVISELDDVKLMTFRLAAGQLESSPFRPEAMQRLREELASLTPDPGLALSVPERQPFYLHLLAQSLRELGDPDWAILTQGDECFARGVPLGDEKPLERTPQVFRARVKERRLDESVYNADMDNYASAELSGDQLEAHFRKEEALGRMLPSTEAAIAQDFGPGRLLVSAMGAIEKANGDIRPIHDGTHGVHLNSAIRVLDRLEVPGPDEILECVALSQETREAVFGISADISSAHRLVPIRRVDWPKLGCRARSSDRVVWLNTVGTFGISSAAYWWSRLFGCVGRWVVRLMMTLWAVQMIYVDDLHLVAAGPRKYLVIWMMIAAYEAVGTPFAYRKFRGGLRIDFIGYHLSYDCWAAGLSLKRCEWVTDWIDRAEANGWMVLGRHFIELAGRLTFVGQVLRWMKPFLTPLHSWAAVLARGTVARMPLLVHIALLYIRKQLRKGRRLLQPALTPQPKLRHAFRTDAKCADGYVVLGGWDLTHGSETRGAPWFSLRLEPSDTPWLFKEDGSSQWASTAAEFLGTMAALKAFGWLEARSQMREWTTLIYAGTDNRANPQAIRKGGSGSWPLMGLMMQMSDSLIDIGGKLRLEWRPREENQEADNLTNEIFDGFDPCKRVAIQLGDLPLELFLSLQSAYAEFDQKRKEFKMVNPLRVRTSKKVKLSEKTPW